MQSHLKLVQYLPPTGHKPCVCAAVWGQGGQVRLASPWLRRRQVECVNRRAPGAGDTAECAAQACPQGLTYTLEWLDAACFVATDPHEVVRACEANPDWHLQCVRFDGSDEALAAVHALLRVARLDARPRA